jgi:hypothetical protein
MELQMLIAEACDDSLNEAYSKDLLVDSAEPADADADTDEFDIL